MGVSGKRIPVSANTKCLLALCLLAIPFFASTQNAVVTGVAPLSAGYEIQLRAYDDPISRKETVLARQTIEADGSFELTAPVAEVQYAFLQVGKDCADFFLQRDKELDVSFIPPERDEKKAEAFYERHFFVPRILSGSGAELNRLIIIFNDTMDAFMEALYPMLVQRKSPKFIADRLMEFEKGINAGLPENQSFVRNYIKYSIASVEQTFLTDRNRLFSKYLKDERPHLNNPAYMDFILQFFQGAVYRMAVINRHEECKAVLNGKAAFAGLERILMEEEPLLKEVDVGRVVLIEGMDGLFGQKDFGDAELIAALRDFGRFSSDWYFLRAAKNMAAKHEMLVKGSEAPDIIFKDLNGAEKKLSDLRGTYVFLELTDATNPYCLRETKVIPSLSKEFKNVRFVTVCVGNTQEEMEAFQARMNIAWEFGGISLTDAAIEAYDIKSLPRFYIIDPKGKFYRIPALDPSRGARSELMVLSDMIRSKGKRRVGQ